MSLSVSRDHEQQLHYRKGSSGENDMGQNPRANRCAISTFQHALDIMTLFIEGNEVNYTLRNVNTVTETNKCFSSTVAIRRITASSLSFVFTPPVYFPPPSHG
ncbi:hypothetical protein DICVIV_09877 [Dictyocaulus viviparus]|uniref:Uncharacterized protein n=1 Tax=Dictyocaulus viviparus TaxID=29172 RepID=A0A0D8XK19_DICVI|nr:hypothetical protein DICVIV_09877 [Dictyocaulus viviparus]